MLVLLLLLASTVAAGPAEIDQLIDLFAQTKCQKDVFTLCERGTVQVSPWLENALRLQRELASDLPLDLFPFVGSHNSFNARADFYGFGDLWLNEIAKVVGERFIWAQQEYTMTDQLNMGVRELHLDPHWVAGELRLCHGAGNVSLVNELLAKIEHRLNLTIDFDSEQLGCSPFDRSYLDGLLEIRTWQDANPGQFLLVHQDDNEGDTFGKTAETISLILRVFGDSIFLPSEFDGQWPSWNELVSRNKTILFQSESGYSAGAVLFEPFLQPAWDENCILYLSECPPATWSNVQGESQIVGPLYDGSEACGLLTPTSIPLALRCPFSVLELDQISPALMSSLVWTWAEGQPGIGCPARNGTDGRWYTWPCGLQLPTLCRNAFGQLTLECSPGDEPSAPRTYQENRALGNLSAWLTLP